MKNFLLILTITLLCSCSNSANYIKVEKNFECVKIGMTQNEVTALVGKPFDTYKWAPGSCKKKLFNCKGSEERWILHSRPGSLDIPSVVFSRPQYRVIRKELVTNDYMF